jgi:threonine dehydratase
MQNTMIHEPSLSALDAAAGVVYQGIAPTRQRRWPRLDARCGMPVWVKHENETPVGAFKVRGGLVYFDSLRRSVPDVAGVVAATAGNHGQSVAFAARRYGIRSQIVVPRGAREGKVRAMRALGADVMEAGHDFQAALEAATRLAAERGWHMVPSFDSRLVLGVASYSLELLRSVPDLETLYVPVGLGSGVCGAIAARDGLGLSTRIVAVVAAAAPAYALSAAAGRVISHEVTTRSAAGMACRTPVADALEIIRRGADRVVMVSDEQIDEAMDIVREDTGSDIEGAAAAGLAALLGDAPDRRGRSAGVVLTGANAEPGS